MPTSLANLPPVPPALKPITPYLQRAEELRKQDPVISYWCAYYAAQVGISLKARDAASRDLLFALLGALEQTKKQIGPSDAIDIETVSSAYVENFALKVFANADNEDRSSHATRSTAKKFLAAANFLEVLKTFPKSDISESNEDKIRYAKWKAADIAKAFREGRKPDPGPPEQEQIHSALTVSPPMNPSDSSISPSSSSPTRSHNIYAPPSNQYSPTRSTGPYGRPTVPPPPPPIPAPVVVELTPGIIAKAQKHCRFAISSLDYEDAEQAKKELRAALAILGG
ncbi:Vta1 like-domain-containing protein [Crassisporium funariophilum]|nr:Vta1 like-domain-containing protein [Crassisporium funariophilum]